MSCVTVGHADAWLDCIACDVIGDCLLRLSKYKSD